MIKRVGLVVTFVLALFAVSVFALQPAAPAAQSAPALTQRQIPADRLQEVPQELADMINNMTIDEFIEMNNGRVPNALRPYTDKPVAVVIEMEGAPLAAVYAAQKEARQAPMSTSLQVSYVQTLQSAQASIVSQIQAVNGTVIDQYTKAYNGVLAIVPANQIANLESMPGVKAVHNAPVHTPMLSASVPLINADTVQDVLGFDGTGITIGIIDTGVDYYHAALGGSGDPADYAADDPTIIEPGTFPTVKVAGGYDFAGTNYDAGSSDPALNIPTPDADPLDGNGHGTHVAATAAGIGSTKTSSGVAPGATIYALKVFGDVAGSTNLTASAIEWAMDPNGDGDISDHLDVLNMSLGSDFGPNDPANDPAVAASNNAVKVGMIVVAASGNAGDTEYITGSPAAADGAISVAASTTGFVTGPTVSISGTSFVTQTNIIYQPASIPGSTFTQTVTAPLSYAGSFTATNTLCDTTGIAANAMSGTIALVQRGDCTFSTKINNAASLGAVAVLIYNNAGDALVSMIGDPVTVPAAFVRQTDGENLVAGVGMTAVINAETNTQTVADAYTPADNIATFSSRGPRGFDSMLKPEITAPGVAIFAAAVGTGQEGASLSGTSMATPHVAGVAALMRQAHPTWSVEHIKAAMMNTAVDLTDDSPVPRQGAGRVDSLAAVNADTVFVGDKDLVSLSWGVIPINTDNYTDIKVASVRNYSSTAKTYNTSWVFGSDSYTMGVSINLPVSITVSGNGVAALPVTLDIDATAVTNDFGADLGEYYGYVILTNTATDETLRLPFYVIPQPYNNLTELDALTTISTTGLGYVDLQHTGPISSSLWAYPVFATDANEGDVGFAGDIRMIGMDYGWTSGTYGSIFVPAIATWDAWHVPQPYFGEYDMYIDVDEDGTSDLVNFNFNAGWWNNQDDNNQWLVIQVDLNTGDFGLGSPYFIYSDFNASFMEWYLPATWNGLDDAADPNPNTDFDFQFLGFDYEGNMDTTEANSFDFNRRPFVFLADDLGPLSPTGSLLFVVNSLGGYVYSQPDGIMLVDYTGAPDSQVYYWPVNVTDVPTVFMPVIFGP